MSTPKHEFLRQEAYHFLLVCNDDDCPHCGPAPTVQPAKGERFATTYETETYHPSNNLQLPTEAQGNHLL